MIIKEYKKFQLISYRIESTLSKFTSKSIGNLLISYRIESLHRSGGSPLITRPLISYRIESTFHLMM